MTRRGVAKNMKICNLCDYRGEDGVAFEKDRYTCRACRSQTRLERKRKARRAAKKVAAAQKGHSLPGCKIHRVDYKVSKIGRLEWEGLTQEEELLLDSEESTSTIRHTTYVITYAQNATPINVNFLTSIENYLLENNAQLIVIPGRYKNPTSIYTQDMEEENWWDANLVKYLRPNQVGIHKNLTVYGDISIQPTATNPLSGFEIFVGTSSAVFGHPKITFRTVASGNRLSPRILTSTGAITLPNYTRSKAGKKGEAHHTFGACVVEIDEAQDIYHIRQIEACEDGSFIDKQKRYSINGIEGADRPLALVFGDMHVAHLEDDLIEATFTDPQSVQNYFHPETTVYHDLLDFDNRNHHSIDNVTDRYARYLAGRAKDSVKVEVKEACEFLDLHTPRDIQALVVRSNHDAAFEKWLDTADPDLDVSNLAFFHEAWSARLEYYHQHRTWPNMFELYYELGRRDRAGSSEHGAKFIDPSVDHKIGDYYVQYHGHRGPNGVKGAINSFAKLGVKTITAHVHSPRREDPAIRVGVGASLNQGYNEDAPSDWLNSHVVIYANGKCSLINLIRGADGKMHWTV